MNVLDAIAMIRHFVADPSDAETAAWVAQAMADYLEHAADGMRLDAALGIRTGRGQSPWWKQERDVKRAKSAQRLIEAYGSARAALAGAHRYASGRGRFASHDAIYGDPKLQAAHDFVATRGRVPTSEKTLKRNADRKSSICCPERPAQIGSEVYAHDTNHRK